MSEELGHLKVPIPTWIERKTTNTAAASLGSWREGKSFTPPPDSDVTFGASTPQCRYPDTVQMIRAAMCPKDVFLAAITAADKAAAVELRQSPPSTVPEVFEVGAPRVIVAGGTLGVSPGTKVNGRSPPAPPPIDAEDGDSMGIPSFDLPPSMSQEMMETSAVLCAFLPAASNTAVGVAKQHITSHAPEAVTDVSHVTFPPTCTVVIKGMPLSIKHDRMWEELQEMRCPPTYLRFHRNDRGLFKNVVYIRFPSRLKAEVGKMELERLSIGGRPLKVEFKKARTTLSQEESARAEAARREDMKVRVQVAFEQAVKELLGNKQGNTPPAEEEVNIPQIKPPNPNAQYEGFSYLKSQLTRDDHRYLKGLAQVHELHYETTATNVFLKKKFQDKHSSRSPALAPARTPPFGPAVTPSHHAVDVAESNGLQFRGIRHWKEQREQGLKLLQIERPLGPGEAPAFGRGRGRPVPGGQPKLSQATMS